jgi:acetyltransferase-like isoleucine patch superfamily enzyme
MSFVSALIQRVLSRVESAAVRSQLRRLRSAGRGIVLGRSVKIEHPECVSLGDRVHINDHCWLSVLTENRETGNPTIALRPELSIGDGCYIGRFGTLACIDRVALGRDVMISDRVFIGDAAHGFARTDLPIRDQYLTSKGAVEIGDGTWIGIGVSIMANVKIGRNCVIGAGSVVTADVPDFCIAVGVPAKVIRRIDD